MSNSWPPTILVRLTGKPRVLRKSTDARSFNWSTDDWRKIRGWEVERWFERLPLYLLEEPKRKKVLQALTHALELVEAGKLKLTRHL